MAATGYFNIWLNRKGLNPDEVTKALWWEVWKASEESFKKRLSQRQAHQDSMLD